MSEDSHLFERVKRALPKLKQLQGEAEQMFGAPDAFYRFYYQSFKAYRIQNFTIDCTKLFRELGDDSPLNPWYETIIKEGTNKEFDLEHNDNWLVHVRPLFEAYFHAKMFLDMMIWCAENMMCVPHIIPSQWAAILCLYKQR